MSIDVICDCGQEFQARNDRAIAQCPNCHRDLVIPRPGAPTFKRYFPAHDEFAGSPQLRDPFERSSAAATTSFVLGLFAIFLAITVILGLLAGIPAIVYGCLALREIRESRGRLTGRGRAVAGIVMGSLASAILPLAILPHLFLGSSHSEGARRAQCVNNLKQIGLAMHNYHDECDHFPPPAITGTDGRPLLSWRVALLPYLEQGDLYRKFRQDEPWDSPHNKALLAEIPQVYVCPSDSGRAADRTATRYQAFVGPGALFEHGKTIQISDVQDGLSNTLMVAEARAAVPWTKPDDLAFVPNGPLPALGSNHTKGVNALVADGSVRFLRHSGSWAYLRSYITRSGGEVLTEE